MMTLQKTGRPFLAELQKSIPVLDEESMEKEMSRLRKNTARVREIPVRDTVALLDRCARKWLDRDYSAKHIEILSHITNQCSRLVTAELEGAMRLLLSENIEKTLNCELGGGAVLDGWVGTEYGKLRREPRGIVFHNISGNAFIVIPVSIAAGLLSKNCNLFKVSRDEPYFACAVYKSLYEIDSSVKDRLSVNYFDSANHDVYVKAISLCDCVLHWGGEKSAHFIGNLCSKYQKKLVLHGPKVSFEVIDRFGGDAHDTAMKVAGDMIAWEQKACLSPRVLFINKALDPDAFAKELAYSLQELSEKFPKTYYNDWNSVKTIQDRQYCIEKYGLSRGVKVYSSYNADYTVLLTGEMPQREDINRCFYRFIFVCPYSDDSEVADWVEANIKPYLQTMGYSGNNEDFLNRMAAMGVTAITKPGDMSRHAPGTSHDGLSNLRELTYAVSSQLSSNN